MTVSVGSRFGAYEVLSPLGSGGMGEVYRALDTRLGRMVALKVLPDALAADAERLARFEREARAASALNHPNIITIHDIGSLGSTPFIIMELVEGKTLRELLAGGLIPVRETVAMAAQMAAGLGRMHEAGIIHRDLKPENVMVNAEGLVKLMDFGLAKLVLDASSANSELPTLTQTELTEAGNLLGTPAYMSPEQARGKVVDFRSDQFALGLIVHEMLTGKPVFRRATPVQTLLAIV